MIKQEDAQVVFGKYKRHSQVVRHYRDCEKPDQTLMNELTKNFVINNTKNTRSENVLMNQNQTKKNIKETAKKHFHLLNL